MNPPLTDESAGILGIVCHLVFVIPLHATLLCRGSGGLFVHGLTLSQTGNNFSESSVPQLREIFKTPITTTEAAAMLPECSPYDHAIDLKEKSGTMGTNLRVERDRAGGAEEMAKAMTDMGAVRPSMSSCSSPMLFVPKATDVAYGFASITAGSPNRPEEWYISHNQDQGRRRVEDRVSLSQRTIRVFGNAIRPSDHPRYLSGDD